MLLDAADEDGESLERRHIRDEVMTLLFAGHDTTTSTVAFMFYELARNPEIARRPRRSSVEMILDETLRKYPPAYIGPRRSVEAFEFNGRTRPGGRARAVLLVGEPPPAGRVARAGGVPPAALQRGEQGEAAARRLRAVRRRLAHLHRDALRPGRDRDDRARASWSASGSSCVPGYELEIRHAPTISPRAGPADAGAGRRAGGRARLAER